MLCIDGVGAFDLILLRAMMNASQMMPDGDTLLPFVMLFYGSTPFWQIQFSQSMFGHLFSLFF